MVDIPSLINGQWVESETTRSVRDFEGAERVRIHGTSPTGIRVAKRAMLQIREQLASTPSGVLLRIVKRAAKDYLGASERELIARLSGSPISYVNASVETYRHWMSHIDQYLEQAFGTAEYERVPIRVHGKQVGYRKHLPTGPVVAVLPANEDGAAAYVLAQLFLSKNPILVKPSSRGASAFATERFIRALHAAILAEAPDRKYLLQAVQMANVLDTPDKAAQVAELGVENCSFVIFGSDASVEEITKAITYRTRKIIKMGTGFSVSVILDDADLGNALNEIYESITEDRGNKCTSTHVLYVQEGVYAQVMAELDKLAGIPHAANPLDASARTARLDAATQDAVNRRIGELYPAHGLQRQDFRVYELDENAHVEELPGAIVFVKKITSPEHFCRLLANDSSSNGIERNLVTSVYTSDERKVDAIAARVPSHIIKWNISSNAINFFIEHQSVFLIREVMQSTVVETLHAQKAHEPLQEVRA